MQQAILFFLCLFAASAYIYTAEQHPEIPVWLKEVFK